MWVGVVSLVELLVEVFADVMRFRIANPKPLVVILVVVVAMLCGW